MFRSTALRGKPKKFTRGHPVAGGPETRSTHGGSFVGTSILRIGKASRTRHWRYGKAALQIKQSPEGGTTRSRE